MPDNTVIIIFIFGSIILFITSIIVTFTDKEIKNFIKEECYQQSSTKDEFIFCRDKLYYKYTGKKTLW